MSAPTRKTGFTLIELLVVISIIAVLSAVGLVSYNGIRSKAMDAKIKSDLNAIKKAYEANYDPTANGGQGGYKQLSPTNNNNSPYFSGGTIPTQPNGSPYPCGVGPDPVPSGSTYGCNVQNAAGYQVNGTLSGSTSSGTPISVISNQGTLVGTVHLNPGTCDTLGTLKNNLVGNWKFDDATSGNTPATVSDSSVNVNTGTWNGNGNPHWIFGVIGGAGSFNGTNDYVSISATPITDLSSWTISAWMKPASLTQNGIVFYNNTGGMGFGIGSVGGGDTPGTGATLRGIYEGVAWLITSYTFPNTTTWHHVVMERSSGTTTFYVDGSVLSGTTNSTFAPSALLTSTGASIGNLGRLFSGMIDDVRIYSRVLTGPEIQLLYNTGIGCSP